MFCQKKKIFDCYLKKNGDFPPTSTASNTLTRILINLTIKTYSLDIKCQNNSESYDRHNFFGTKFRGDQNFSFTMWGFFNEREYSGTDWLDLLIPSSYLKSLCWSLFIIKSLLTISYWFKRMPPTFLCVMNIFMIASFHFRSDRQWQVHYQEGWPGSGMSSWAFSYCCQYFLSLINVST